MIQIDKKEIYIQTKKIDNNRVALIVGVKKSTTNGLYYFEIALRIIYKEIKTRHHNFEHLPYRKGSD